MVLVYSSTKLLGYQSMIADTLVSSLSGDAPIPRLEACDISKHFSITIEVLWLDGFKSELQQADDA